MAIILKTEIQECRNAGMQECRNAGMQECRNAEMPKYVSEGEIT